MADNRNQETISPNNGGDKFASKRNNGKKNGKRFKSSGSNNVRHKNCNKPQSFIEGKAFKADAYNDPSWYAKNAQLLKDAASIPFNTAVGMSMNITDGTTTQWSNQRVNIDKAAGILAIKVLPHLGISENADDPVNIAASSIYSFTVHGNSRNTSYNRADEMIALGAADSVFCFINWCQRLYGIMMNPNQWSRYQAHDLITANGVNWKDLEANISDFRAWLNQLIVKASAIWVPNNLPVFQKHSWMFSNVYRDHDTKMAQYYMFVPEAFYIYSDTYSDQGSALVYTPLVGDGPAFTYDVENTGDAANTVWNEINSDLLMDFADIRSYGNEMIQAILDSEDVQTMFADIRMAYGANGLFKLAPVDESYLIEPTFNKEVLTEITNLYAVHRFQDADQTAIVRNYSILQSVNTQNLVFKPKTTSRIAGWDLNNIVNFDVDEPSPSDVMVATRLIAKVDTLTVDGGFIRANILSAGTELVTGMNIFMKPGKLAAANTELVVSDEFSSIIPYFFSLTEQNAIFLNSRVSQLATVITQFDWAPTLYYLETEYNGGTITTLPVMALKGIIADVVNVSTITAPMGLKLDTTAILSELDVPVE
nr:putative capsid [Marmot picobirnavirus]